MLYGSDVKIAQYPNCAECGKHPTSHALIRGKLTCGYDEKVVRDPLFGGTAVKGLISGDKLYKPPGGEDDYWLILASLYGDLRRKVPRAVLDQVIRLRKKGKVSWE